MRREIAYRDKRLRLLTCLGDEERHLDENAQYHGGKRDGAHPSCFAA